MARLSKHFTSDEFRCPCCGKLLVEPRLLGALELWRFLCECPLQINSGFRCVRHNADLGGSLKSQHLKGKAADVTPLGRPLDEAYCLALRVDEFKNGGIGLYLKRNFIHVDIRGYKSRWCE